MKRVISLFFVAAALLLPLSASASVICKNFTWLSTPTFDYVPGTGYTLAGDDFIEARFVGYTVECSRSSTSDGPMNFNVRPQIRPTPAAQLGAARLPFGYASAVGCSNTTATLGGLTTSGLGVDSRVDWTVPLGSANFQLFEVTYLGQRIGIHTCVVGTPRWPVPPGTYTSSDTWEFQAWNVGGTIQRWPTTAGTWDPIPGSLPVSITVTSRCIASLSANTITISYMPFSQTAVPGTPTVRADVQCNTDYQLELSPATDIAAGIQYDLKVKNSSGVEVFPTTTLTGTGAVQPYDISASAIAGQAGDCTGGCAGTKYHTLLVTFN
jgi:hypothetical protein